MMKKRAFTPAVILSGVAVGIFQAFSPSVLWWLDAADVWGVALAFIAVFNPPAACASSVDMLRMPTCVIPACSRLRRIAQAWLFGVPM